MTLTGVQYAGQGTHTHTHTHTPHSYSSLSGPIKERTRSLFPLHSPPSGFFWTGMHQKYLDASLFWFCFVLVCLFLETDKRWQSLPGSNSVLGFYPLNIISHQ